MVTGFTVVLVLLLFAFQVVLGLYERSTVSAAAFDAARLVAGSDGGVGAQVAAQDQVRRLLGDDDGSLQFEWRYVDVDGDGEPDVVELRVLGPARRSLVPFVPIPFAQVDRTVTVRIERLR